MLATLLCVILPGIDPGATVNQVQVTYRAGGDLSASFKQTYVDKMRGKTRVESGKMWVKKDGRVRWSYREPTAKDFVFDGKTAYFYEPENAQVTVFDRFRDSPIAGAMQFLWGQGELAKSFDISACSRDCPAPASGEAVVQLVPKTALAAVEHIALVVDPKAGRVRRSVVYDPLGNRTEYQFDDLQFGATVDDAKFAFTVPTGVSVLRAAADGSLAPKADPAAKPDAAKP